jgi:hypothetical protein
LFSSFFQEFQAWSTLGQNGLHKEGLDPPMYYEDNTTSKRKGLFCLKPIKLVESKAAKNAESVHIQLNR